MNLTEKKLKILINEVLAETNMGEIRRIIKPIIDDLTSHYPNIRKEDGEWQTTRTRGKGRWRVKITVRIPQKEGAPVPEELHIIRFEDKKTKNKEIVIFPMPEPQNSDWYPYEKNIQNRFSYDEIMQDMGEGFRKSLGRILKRMNEAGEPIK